MIIPHQQKKVQLAMSPSVQQPKGAFSAMDSSNHTSDSSGFDINNLLVSEMSNSWMTSLVLQPPQSGINELEYAWPPR